MDNACGILDSAHDDAKAVGADPRQVILAVESVYEPLRDGIENLVAAAMAQRLVDIAETLEIEQDHGYHLRLATARAHLLAQAVDEQGAIGQPGEHVIVREIFQFLLLLDGLQRERDIRRHFVEKRELFFVEESRPAAKRMMAATTLSSTMNGTHTVERYPCFIAS